MTFKSVFVMEWLSQTLYYSARRDLHPANEKTNHFLPSIAVHAQKQVTKSALNSPANKTGILINI
jgi:hypothetical protein